ncbi:diguanylate cyclase [Halothiobacillus sp.]|uniref:diguanylate cyclase n=1 Tax=Halothiobacillus sp. TaxID=1891311 RepID=UPI002AD2D38F|nr:diguanylate cyclase [Halothiobacillus sp.]
MLPGGREMTDGHQVGCTLVFEGFRALIRRIFRSIRLLIIAAALVVSVVVAVAMYWATSSVFDRTVRQSAVEMSASLADGTFNAMYQIMRQGWTRKQLNEFLQTIRSQGQIAPDTASIELYRGSKVVALFGTIQQPKPDALVQAAFATGQTQTRMADGAIRYDRPLIAEAQCLRCHTNAVSGDVLGVMSVSQPVANLTSRAHEDLLGRLLWIMPLPLLVALLIALLLGGRMARSLRILKGAIARVERVEDLAHVRFSDAQTGFSELDDVLIEVDHLTDKVRNLAVDRNLLEFEIRLLERFVITSDVVRDWRRYVRDLLTEINTVLPVHGVFTAFSVGDRPPGIELFWHDAVAEPVAATISYRVQSRVGEVLGPTVANLIPRQHTIEPGNRLPLTNARLIDLRTKEISMDVPMMRGVVGLIVPSDQDQSPVTRLLIESILSTMLNVVGSVRAIEKHTEDLEFYATRDPLTQLYNQRMFWSLLEYEVGRARRHDYQFGVLVIDMDNFKNINDNYGHSFGDLFLCQVAEALQDGLRAGDILARYGGDEFVAILPEAGAQASEMVANRLLAQIRGLSVRTPEGGEVGASLSLGMAIGLTHADTARGLFAVADSQMYRAKLGGKNQLALPGPLAPHQDLIASAVETDVLFQTLTDQTLRPIFQPIFSVQDALVERSHELLLQQVGMEVFARIFAGQRWREAQDFIGVIEHNGMNEAFDRALLSRVLLPEIAEQCEGLIFVNISALTVRSNSFLPDVVEWVDACGLARDQLVFELNERESLADLGVFDRFVEALHEHGFKFAIGNASSGHWVFQHLRRYEVDFVKVSADWLVTLERASRDRAFIDGLLGLARALSVTVIAHRVETAEQLASVRAAGITWVQGRLLSAEMSLADGFVPNMQDRRFSP